MPKIKKLFAGYTPEPFTEEYDTAFRHKLYEKAPKPSDAIFAMIRGIKAQLKSDNFFINMLTFGSYDEKGKMCYGCAATCAIIDLTGYEPEQVVFRNSGDYFDPQKVGRKVYERNLTTLHQFEEAINGIRQGKLDHLLYFYGYNWIKQIPYIRQTLIEQGVWHDGMYMFGNEDDDQHEWKEMLKKYDALAKFMAKHGL